MTKTYLAAAVFVCATLGILPASARAADGGGMRCFNGYAYTLDGGDYRYTEHHEQKRVDDRIRKWYVTYVGANGKVIATKRMAFSDNDTIPVYTMKIRDDGYQEGIRHRNDAWTMFRKTGDNAEDTKTFKVSSPMAADSGFHPLIQHHFDRLMSGKTIPFRFAAAGRQSVIKLRARRGEDTSFEGKPAVVFIAELDMMFVNYFVNSLKLTYDPDTKRLLEYRGIGNMHDASGDVYPVRVTYSGNMPAVAREHGAPGAVCGSLGTAP